MATLTCCVGSHRQALDSAHLYSNQLYPAPLTNNPPPAVHPGSTHFLAPFWRLGTLLTAAIAGTGFVQEQISVMLEPSSVSSNDMGLWMSA